MTFIIMRILYSTTLVTGVIYFFVTRNDTANEEVMGGGLVTFLMAVHVRVVT